MIALRAAQVGVSLSRLEVTVGSDSDNRGLISEGAGSPPGPLHFQITVRIEAAGVEEAVLRDIVRWAESHSPVGDALRRAVVLDATVLAGKAAAAR